MRKKGESVPDANRDEPLSWGIVANISEGATWVDKNGVRRPGARVFRKGACVWLLPIRWSDGGEYRFVVGMPWDKERRWVRTIVSGKVLTNLRVKPIYSEALINVMTMPWTAFAGTIPSEAERDEVFLYLSKRDAEQHVRVWASYYDDESRERKVSVEPDIACLPREKVRVRRFCAKPSFR